MDKNKIADIVLYGGGILLLLWAILKSIGIIHSPVWIEMFPYFIGDSSIIGIAYKFGQFKRELELDINDLKNRVNHFNKLENEHDLCLQGKLKIH